MWSLNVLTRLFSLWSVWLSSSAMFSEEDEDFLQSLPLNMIWIDVLSLIPSKFKLHWFILKISFQLEFGSHASVEKVKRKIK
jgi:hypothetical protein